MSQEVTSVTYRRHHGQTTLGTGRFSRVKTAKIAGGLGETLCPEITSASAASGRLFAGRANCAHPCFRRHFPMAGGGSFERAHPAFGPNAGRSPDALVPRYVAMHPAMHPRLPKSRG